jgi:lysozyme family protein
MIDNFGLSLGYVLRSEGGYVNDPQDPGGATNEGVTQHQYDIWRIAHHQETRSVRFIDPNEVEAFYKAWYWDKVVGNILPSGVDYCVFDCAVNSGPHRAAEWLQEAVGALPDGQIGQKTMAAVAATDPEHIIEMVCNERLAFLETLPTWHHFGNGWTNRVNQVEARAKAMAS